MSEAQGRVARHGARAMQDLRDAIGGYAELSSEFGGAHIEGLQFFGEMLTGMNCSNWHRNSTDDSCLMRLFLVPKASLLPASCRVGTVLEFPEFPSTSSRVPRMERLAGKRTNRSLRLFCWLGRPVVFCIDAIII